MGELKYLINYDESINRWWITDMQKEIFESPVETFEADVNLGEAYVQIVYPVRKSFLQKNKIKNIRRYKGKYDRVYFPFENNRVDFTTFLHNPHHVWVYAKTGVFIKEEGIYPFELYTCGGMKIWVNGILVDSFTPYTRNIPSKKEVSLQFNKGYNEIEVYADELAERDVFFYYEMRYKGRNPIEGIIHLDCEENEIIETEKFLSGCYFEKDLVTEGRVLLKYDNSVLKEDKNIFIRGDINAAKLNNVEMGKDQYITVKKEKDFVDLGDIHSFNVGAFKVLVGCKVSGFEIIRELLLGISPKNLISVKPADTIEERKNQALKFICEHGENVVNRTMAILEIEKEMTSKAYECLDSSIVMIEKKQDCADFYLAPMFLLINRYKKYLDDSLYNRIKSAILNFRYWIDEPGNDVMWYFSENHALLFHIAQYLAGYFYPDEIFKVSKRTGIQQYKIGRQRLLSWFEIFSKYGYAEWNSATYIPVDLIGFFVLYELAPDADIKNAAIKALDFTFDLMERNSFQGIMSSSFGRVYEDTIKMNKQVEPNFCQWVANKKGYISSGSRAVALFCLSEYTPPSIQEELKLENGMFMTTELDQGISRVKTYSCRTNDYFMACVRRFKPFEHGHQQHLMNITLGKDGVQYFINHPGERPYSGGNRPSYWAGNGTMPYIEQYRNTMIMIYKIEPHELVHYIHAYTTFYKYDEYEIKDKWLFIRVEDAYLATYFSNGIIEIKWGANTGKEIISKGLNHGIIIKCGSKTENGNFEKFKEELSKIKIQYDGNELISFRDPQHGKIQIVGGISYLNGKPIEYQHKSQIEIKKGFL